MIGLTVPEAARRLGIEEEALHANVRAGCPTLVRGGRGRGRRTLVDVDVVREWRARRSAPPARIDLHAVSRALYRLHTKPPAGSIHQLRKRLRIAESAALEYLLEAYRAIALEITGRPVADEELPPEMMGAIHLLAHLRLLEMQAKQREEDLKR